MDAIWTRLERWLAEHAPPAAAGLNPPASAEQIAQAEATLGVRFPDDVRACYLRHDGQDADAPWMIDGWEWLSLERMCDEWAVWKGLLDDGDFEDATSGADGVRVRTDWWHPGWIPFTYSGAGDHHCIDLAPAAQGEAGQIIEMWHDDDPRPVVANGIRAFLSDYVDALEAGQYVFDDGQLLPREDAG